MGERTGIAWTDHTFNSWIGCTKVSPGCDNCYAEVSRPASAMKIKWGVGQPRHRTSESNWKEPLRWDRAAQRDGVRRKVFCASLADVFDNEVAEEWRTDLFRLIAQTPHLIWLVLTKRIGLAAKVLHSKMIDAPPLPNIWIGASVVNPAEAARDLYKLRDTPAAKHFVSYEPALELIDWTPYLAFIDWLIVGGESSQGGAKARPFDVAWARSTIAQCKAAQVPCFVKQLGSNATTDHRTRPEGESHYWTKILKDRAGADPAEWPRDLRVQDFPA